MTVSTVKMKACRRTIRNVEDRPDDAQHHLADDADPAADTSSGLEAGGQRQQRDQHEDHLAGEHVAEESQRQRHGLGDEAPRLPATKLNGIISACRIGFFERNGCSVSSPMKPPRPLSLDAVAR